MEKTIYVTDGIPPNAKILLVDMQRFYFDETDYYEDDNVSMAVDDRLNTMEIELIELRKKGHTIYAILDDREPIISELKGIPNVKLPFWGVTSKGFVPANELDPAMRYDLEPKVKEVFSKDDVILVCGLWKEMCVFAVTRLLQKEGFTAYLSNNPALCLENGLVWSDDDVIDLERECTDAGITIEYVSFK